MAKLIIKLGSLVLKEINLTQEKITIGRSNDNDVVLDNQSASSHHAQIKKSDDQYTIEDLNSTNGTLVNNHKISNKLLEEGDIIAIGKHEIWFVGENTAVVEKDSDLEKTVFVRSPNPTPATKLSQNVTPHVTPKTSEVSVNKNNDSNSKIIVIIVAVLAVAIIGYIVFKMV